MRPFSIDPKVFRAVTIISLSAGMLMSCRSIPPSDAVPVTSSSGGGSTSSSGSSSISAGLYIAVANQWEGTSDWIDAGNCQIPLGAATGTSTTCVVHAPEARMYFSSTRFLVGTADSTTCKIVSFSPYYYLGSSTDNAFIPPWDPSATTGVDCTASPIPASCYNGPAKTLVSDFPKHTGLYFLPALQKEFPFEVDPANALAQPNNRWIANSKTNKAAGIAGQYEAGSMQDYVVTCADEWGEMQYRITMTLADEDSSTGEDPAGPLDTYSDWDGY